MTPEVVNPRFSNAIEGGAARRGDVETKKASRKWLAFNDFYRGEATVFGIASGSGETSGTAAMTGGGSCRRPAEVLSGAAPPPITVTLFRIDRTGTGVRGNNLNGP